MWQSFRKKVSSKKQEGSGKCSYAKATLHTFVPEVMIVAQKTIHSCRKNNWKDVRTSLWNYKGRYLLLEVWNNQTSSTFWRRDWGRISSCYFIDAPSSKKLAMDGCNATSSFQRETQKILRLSSCKFRFVHETKKATITATIQKLRTEKSWISTGSIYSQQYWLGTTVSINNASGNIFDFPNPSRVFSQKWWKFFKQAAAQSF